MPRRRRGLQVEFAPGTSGTVEGPFKDKDGDTVSVAVAVRSCEEPGGGEVSVAKSRGRWSVQLPPDAVQDLDGLSGEDGVAVRLTIVSRPCPKPGTPGQGGQDTSEPPPPPEPSADIGADVLAPDEDIDDVADIAAPAPPDSFR
jgi:hypothetical protein